MSDQPAKRFTLRSETLVQSVSIAVLLTIVARILGFARGIIFARSLDSEHLGTWALINNSIEILALIAVIGIPGGLCRYVERYRQKGQLGAFLRQSIVRSMSFALLLFFLGLLFRKQVAHLLFGAEDYTSLAVLTLIGTLAIVAFNMIQGVLQGLRSFRLNSVMQVTQGAIFTILALLLLNGWRRDAVANITAHLIATGISTVVLGYVVWSLYRRSETSCSSSKLPHGSWRSLVFYSLGSWGGGTLAQLWRIMDRYMVLHLDPLGHEASLEQIGSYFIAEKVTDPLDSLAALMGLILLPHAVSLWEKGKQREAESMIQYVTKVSVVVLTMAGAAVVVLRPYILTLICGRVPEYAYLVMPLVVSTLGTLALQYILRTYLLCRERIWLSASIWPVCIVANCALNWILIEQYHLLGAVMATLASSFLGSTLVLLAARHCGMKLNLGIVVIAFIPLVLVLPMPIMLAALTIFMVIIAKTELVMNTNEKRLFDQWFIERFQWLPIRLTNSVV